MNRRTPQDIVGETVRCRALVAAIEWLDECERRCKYDMSADAWCAWRGAKQAVDGLTDGAHRLERQAEGSVGHE